MKISAAASAEKWDIYEIMVNGPEEGNPFTDHSISGIFSSKNETVRAEGFYDGGGSYKVRFMPSFTGHYDYEIDTDFAGKTSGEFEVTEPSDTNHGPVRVAGRYHFAYEDGTPYYSVGTTCYVWELQSDELIEQTLESLKGSGFNKIRFCILPKHYDYNLKEPRSYPYEGTPVDSSVLTPDNFGEYTFKTEGNCWDLTRFNPGHFRHIEKCIKALCDIGVEADLIVMHPYDRWGFSMMSREHDQLYWRYVIARFSAFRNVWWSLANEYDVMPAKTIEDWEQYADILCRYDPYNHLRSIHNCRAHYDYTRPWITHCSIQRQDIYKTAELVHEWRIRYQKPVVMDEISYEGNIQFGWGNISGEEMVRRFWETAVRGGYPGHGETYLNKDNVLWWSHGGKLRGESWKRAKFLRRIMSETPGIGLAPLVSYGAEDENWDCVCGVPEDKELAKKTGYRIYYFSFMRPSFRDFCFDEETGFHVDVIDTWNMTVEDRGIHRGKFRIELPGTQYMAVRIYKA